MGLLNPVSGLIKKARSFGKKVGQESYKRSNLKKGVEAFRSWKAKKTQPEMPAPKQVGEFSTGIDTKLKTPKVSQLGSLGVRKPSGFQLDAPFK